MSTSLRTRIIKIGNSQGIRIPKLLLDQLGLDEEAVLGVVCGVSQIPRLSLRAPLFLCLWRSAA